MNEEMLFELALSTPAIERSALLDRECAGDAALRARVEALLAAHEQLERNSVTDGESTARQAGEFRSRAETLTPTAADIVPTPSTIADGRPAEGVGAVLAGRYKLVEEIGEGGMGTVWMAQQTAPVKRVVAVKVIKAGMDSRAVLARFDAERQALALMDHPNIARVLDAGTTESGRPFFVMELVKGVPITRFCDERRLSLGQRLELFLPVCQAIQHAHQKGLIHRDIKPSNVMVALYDDHPVPKVIDFGVAKATGEALTEHTCLTSFGGVVGTPEYMSPEQASLNNLDIDTRSDVYALGVLLYELLTGSTPVDRRSLGQSAIMEILRIVREVEPPTPSSRLSTQDGLPSIAATRSVEPARLAELLRGELDWIVMKALEKDRARRYETANGLARDIQRYLADELVEARPPSAGYRLGKFARRHQGRVTAASLLLLALLAGTIGTSWGYVRAVQARKAEAQRAESERLAKLDAQQQSTAAETANAQAQQRLAQIEKGNELLTGIFIDLDIRAVKQGDKPLETVLADRLVKAAGQLEGESVGDLLVVATLQERLGQSLLSLGFAPQAIPVLEKARATREAKLGLNDPGTLASMNNLATGYLDAGKLEQALPLLEETLRLRQAKLGPDHPDTLQSMNNLAEGNQAAGKLDQALPLLEETLRLRQAKLGPDHPDTLNSMNNLAAGYRAAGKLDHTLPLHEQTLRLLKARFGPDHPDTLTSMNNLAESYAAAGKLGQALPLLEDTLWLMKARLGPDHSRTLATMNNLAASYGAAGKLDQALRLHEETVRLAQAKLGPDHPYALTSMNNLAADYRAAGKLDQALPLHEETLRGMKASLGPDHPLTLAAMNNLAADYRAAGKFDQALLLREERLRLMKAKLGPDHTDTRNSLRNLEFLRNLATAPDRYRLELARNGPRHINTLLARRDMAQLSMTLNRLDEAEQVLVEIIGEMKDRAADDPILVFTIGLLQNCHTTRARTMPDSWLTFQSKSLLGGALLGQKKYAEAEPLLLQGYAGMKAREKSIPPPAAARVPAALDRLIELFTATKKAVEVKKWQVERARYAPDPAS